MATSTQLQNFILLLKNYIESLQSSKQVAVAIRLTKLTLPIWDNYVEKNVLIYRDKVVGMEHTVDSKLLEKTITAIEQNLHSDRLSSKIFALRSQFDDPIVALQDTDWELPDEVQNTFYSVYNLFDAFLGKVQTIFDELTIYVSINQAIDALKISKLMTVDEINRSLNEEKT